MSTVILAAPMLALAWAVPGLRTRHRVHRRLAAGTDGPVAAAASPSAVGPELVVDAARHAVRSPQAAAVAGVTLGGAIALGGGRWLAALALGGAVGGFAWRRHLQAQPVRRRRAQLPGALDRLAAALRGGASVPAALVTAGERVDAPLGPELAALGHEAGGGRAMIEVLDDWADKHGDRATRLAATALVLAETVGAAPARAADGVAATLRERAELSAERRALATQARVSAVVLSVAPAGFALLLAATDASAARFLLGSTAGWMCLSAGLALDVAGAYWMARLTRGTDQ